MFEEKSHEKLGDYALRLGLQLILGFESSVAFSPGILRGEQFQVSIKPDGMKKGQHS
jgi:hypothetical protein